MLGVVAVPPGTRRVRGSLQHGLRAESQKKLVWLLATLRETLRTHSYTRTTALGGAPRDPASRTSDAKASRCSTKDVAGSMLVAPSDGSASHMGQSGKRGLCFSNPGDARACLRVGAGWPSPAGPCPSRGCPPGGDRSHRRFAAQASTMAATSPQGDDVSRSARSRPHCSVHSTCRGDLRGGHGCQVMG